jgi:hypothetical protein
VSPPLVELRGVCTYSTYSHLVQNCTVETRHFLGVTNRLVLLQQTRERRWISEWPAEG